MISIIWFISGIQSLLALIKGVKSNSQYFCQHVIPDIQQNICSSSRRKTLNDSLLHLDNAKAHNSRFCSEKSESATAQRVPHPLYGPDGAPSDFLLFGSLKEEFLGMSLTWSDDFIFPIRQIFDEIPEITLKNVFTNWISSASWVMKKDGEYYTKSLNESNYLYRVTAYDAGHELSHP
jgi:hypothetical protein